MCAHGFCSYCPPPCLHSAPGDKHRLSPPTYGRVGLQRGDHPATAIIGRVRAARLTLTLLESAPLVVSRIFDRRFPYLSPLYKPPHAHFGGKHLKLEEAIFLSWSKAHPPFWGTKHLILEYDHRFFGGRKRFADTTNPPLCQPYLYVTGVRRRVSMATASALEGLGPMERRDSKVGMMIKMFKSPDTHAPYLTASRFAHDLITVGPWKAFLRERYLVALLGSKTFLPDGASENSANE